MKEDPAQDGEVPDVVAGAGVVEGAGPPLLWDLGSVDDGADEVDGDALGDGGVEVVAPGGAADEVELDDGGEAGGREEDVEGDAGPGEVGTVEGRVPGQEGAEEAEDGGAGHVDGARDGLAVKGRPLGREDAGRDEEGDARVVDAGEAVEQRVVRDAVHRVPQRRAQQALARRREEARRDQHVSRGAGREGRACRVQVEGDGEHDDEADRVRPDVDRLVRRPEDRDDALGYRAVEAVPAQDVRVDAPRVRQVFVANQPRLRRPGQRVRDALCHELLRAPRPVDALVEDLSGVCEGTVDAFPSFVQDGREVALLRVRARFQFRKIALHQAHSRLRLLLQRLPSHEHVLVSRLQRLHQYLRPVLSGAPYQLP